MIKEKENVISNFEIIYYVFDMSVCKNILYESDKVRDFGSDDECLKFQMKPSGHNGVYAVNTRMMCSQMLKKAIDTDFKGGLLRDVSSKAIAAIPENSQTCVAADGFTISPKPSASSKGYENTYKILQSQLESNRLKAVKLLEKFDACTLACRTSYSTIEAKPNYDHIGSTRLELELLALERFSDYVKEWENEKSKCSGPECISFDWLHLLHKFGSKGLTNPSESEKAVINLIEDQCLQKDEMVYHIKKCPDGSIGLKVVSKSSPSKVLCGNRVSQMTRAYDDIEAVTRLLEEKEKDLELTVQIGNELLMQNNTLEAKVSELEGELRNVNDDRTQLLYELNRKNELIAVLTNDVDDSKDGDTPTFSKSLTLDLLQKKIDSLQDENKTLKMEASQLANQTEVVEAHERQLMEDITAQLNESNSQFDCLNLELERLREENRLQHEQIVNLTARLSETQMRLHQLTHDNDENVTLLSITKENQNSLALELMEFKQRYQEVLGLLQEAQDQLRKQRKKIMPQARNSIFSTVGYLQPDSLQSELMESSMHSENSLDSGISNESQRLQDRIGRLVCQVPGNDPMNGSVPPYKKVFDTVRCASKANNFLDNGYVSMKQIGAMSMSNSIGPRMTPYALSNNEGHKRDLSRDSYAKDRTLSYESLCSESESIYPGQSVGVPGAPGAKDLEDALKRLTPAEVLARRAMLSYAPVGTYNYDEPSSSNLPPLGIRTPESIMSSSSLSSSSLSASMHHWRLPQKLQIIKPIEGSQTLHHWSRLATPTLSGLLDERPGVTTRGGRGLDDLGMQIYNLSDVEEDISDDLPGKQFDASCCTYTFTTSMVMHPDDGIINDTSFLSQSQMSSRLASNSTSRQPSCPPTPRICLSRKNSCSTFSVNMGLASMLNERGIRAVTPSALNTPTGLNFSPTITPCNSPEGSPIRSASPEPIFNLLSSGADLIKRRIVGSDIERPNPNAQKQKILLSRLERRALKSLKLVEKVESIGLENIITMQSYKPAQLAGVIANHSSSPTCHRAQLRTEPPVNIAVNDLFFDRDQIKDVLHKGLTADRKVEKQPSAQALNPSQSARNAPSLTGEVDVRNTRVAHSAQDSSLQQSSSTNNARFKQMQRQKSRRNLKNGIATQRSDLGTIVSNSTIVANVDIIAVGGNNSERETTGGAPNNPGRESQGIASFVGSVSSLLFGRKGGWF